MVTSPPSCYVMLVQNESEILAGLEGHTLAFEANPPKGIAEAPKDAYIP